MNKLSLLSQRFNTTLILGLMASIVFATSARAQRIELLDRMMFTLNPEVQTDGPIFRDESGNQKEYISEVFRLLLNESHKEALPYLEAGDTKAYYAFLVLGLTVPLQEGLYLHFRGVENDGTLCRDDVNTGEILGVSATKTKEYFKTYLLSGEVPFLANCQDVQNERYLKQIVRGYDGSDMGMMQVSIRWHSDDFLANRKFESVKKSIQYGLGFLMKGYRIVYRNSDDYRCLSKFFSSKVIYENLIRGTWAGHYNSGSIKNTCRFKSWRSSYRAHDEHFEQNLNKVLNFTETLSIPVFEGFEVELNEEVESAVFEVIKNFKNNTNKRSALEQILADKNEGI